MTKQMEMVRRSAVAAVMAAFTLAASAGCSRTDIDAVNLANEGDQSLKVDLDGAISKYEQATKLDPNNHIIFYKLGIAYEKKEAWDKVASTMSAALAVTSVSPLNSLTLPVTST